MNRRLTVKLVGPSREITKKNTAQPPFTVFKGVKNGKNHVHNGLGIRYIHAKSDDNRLNWSRSLAVIKR